MSFKKSIVFLLAAACAIGLIFLATSAFAQDTIPVLDGEIVTPEAEMTWDQFSNQLGKVVSDWRTIGCIAGIVALINLLILVLRFKPLNEWLALKKLKWLKVYIAAGLGALLTFFTSYQTGAGWMQSAILGLGFGLTAVGTHQAKAARKKEKDGG